jgi:hypothetical protein
MNPGATLSCVVCAKAISVAGVVILAHRIAGLVKAGDNRGES